MKKRNKSVHGMKSEMPKKEQQKKGKENEREVLQTEDADAMSISWKKDPKLRTSCFKTSSHSPHSAHSQYADNAPMR
jgi:hypothetical protein